MQKRIFTVSLMMYRYAFRMTIYQAKPGLLSGRARAPGPSAGADVPGMVEPRLLSRTGALSSAVRGT